jgi:metallophosphoesterase (TIGR03767 family)
VKRASSCLAAVAVLCAAPAALADPAGKTTVRETIRPTAGSGYVALQKGPGERYLVRRAPGAKAHKHRAKTRRSLAFFGQLTDPQIADAMSPARVDFLDPAGSELSSAWRPQETLGLRVFDQTIRNLNDNAKSTVKDGKGKRDKLDFVLATGDMADNQQLNETRWFKKVLDGGTVDPFSGKAVSATNPCNAPQATIDQLNAAVANRLYTGVADYDDWRGAPPDRYAGFWDPDEAPPSGPYAAFPRYPGLLERSLRPFSAQGIDVPWYITRGNHDGLIQGNAPASTDLFRAIAVGCLKVFPSAAIDPAQFSHASESEVFTQIANPTFITQLLAGAKNVPPDPDRRILSTADYKREVGNAHGYRHIDKKEKKASKGAAAYYAFSPKKGIELISLDTVAEGGGQNGNLDDPQYRWLEKTLKKAQKAHRLIIAYGHHTLASMDNTRTDEQAGACNPPKPGCDADPRKSTPLHLGTTGAKSVRNLFLKYRNFVAYVAGHTHSNAIRSYHKGKAAFWQINTASHADWPQQSREIQLMDNRDGTLSIFATILNSASPIAAPAAGTPATTLNDAQLGALSRTLAYNEPQVDKSHLGTRKDRNVELLLRKPR